MSRIAGVNNIRTGQKIHIRSISKRGRSKFLTLFMLDNERQLLEKDNLVLLQRHDRNAERIESINQEIRKSIVNEFNSTSEDPVEAEPKKVKPKKWQTKELNV